MRVIREAYEIEPIDFYELYAKPVDEWLQEDIEYFSDGVTGFFNRLEMLSLAYKTAVNNGNFDISDARMMPQVHVSPSGFYEDEVRDSNGVVYWFLFKQNTNGMSFAVCIG